MSDATNPENLRLDLVRPADLVPYHRNPRVGNVALIVESLQAHTQYKPLIVNRGSLTGRPNEVLAGNHLLQAGLQLGLDRMTVHWLDVDDDEAARIVLVDNRASDKGGYDMAELAGLLVELDGLGGTGYTDGDLARMLNGLEAGEQDGLNDPDDVPTAPAIPITQAGDVWLLGPHRLICGDSTRADVVKTVTEGAEVDALWTDPPYGVNYVGKTKESLTIQNDGPDGLADLLRDAFDATLPALRPGAPCYIAAPPGPDQYAFYEALTGAGYLVRQVFVWVKNALVLGRSDYHYKHEPILVAETPDPDAPADVSRETSDLDDALEHAPILYGFTPGGKGRLGRGGDHWYGDNKQHSVFEIAKPPASRENPTMKPTELIVQTLRNSVTRKGTVLDIFAGSGSTIIAAHRLNLVARAVEIDPHYCDIICRRYQEHTGVMPILERTGKPVTFVTEAP